MSERQFHELPYRNVKSLLANAITALRCSPEWADVLAYDDFALHSVALRPAPWMPG